MVSVFLMSGESSVAHFDLTVFIPMLVPFPEHQVVSLSYVEMCPTSGFLHFVFISQIMW